MTTEKKKKESAKKLQIALYWAASCGGCEIAMLDDDKIRNFPEHRQQILDKLISVRNIFNPDIVFCPSSFDTHQDHETVRNESFRSFKNCTMFGYEMPWNNLQFKNDLFVELDKIKENIVIKK